MLEQQMYALASVAELRELVRAYPWVTLVSSSDDGSPVVSHLPIVLDPAADGVVVLGHLARADAELHELGRHDVVLVVEGPNGYISPSFYRAGPYVPTWNFVVAHLHGRPELLDGATTFGVLEQTVEHFENARSKPWSLYTVDEYAHSIAPYTTGFRLTPARVVGKSKLSQDKPREVIQRVIAALDSDDVHRNPVLAQTMRQALTAGE